MNLARTRLISAPSLAGETARQRSEGIADERRCRRGTIRNAMVI